MSKVLVNIEDGSRRIRSAHSGDANILCIWWNDGAVMAHAGFPNGLGTSVEEIIDELKGDTLEHQRLIIEIDDRAVGEMSYRTVGEKTAEMGIKICLPDLRNRGHGSRFLKMLITYLFETLCYEKIILDTNLNNTRAQHVYEKLGFREIRKRIDAWKNQLGELQSSVDYEMTRAMHEILRCQWYED